MAHKSLFLLEALFLLLATLGHLCGAILQPKLCVQTETYLEHVPLKIHKFRVTNETIWRSRNIPICCEGYQEDSEYGSMCTPICPEGCQNGGTCVEPNKCKCPDAYTGSTCFMRNSPWNRRLASETIAAGVSVQGENNGIAKPTSAENSNDRRLRTASKFAVSSFSTAKQVNWLMWLAPTLLTIFNALHYRRFQKL